MVRSGNHTDRTERRGARSERESCCRYHRDRNCSGMEQNNP
jgi:hypothetical protein